MVQLILSSAATVDASSTTTTSWLRSTRTNVTNSTFSESTSTTADNTTDTKSESITTGTKSFTAPSFRVTTSTTRDVTLRASTTLTSDPRATTEEFNTPSSVESDNSTAVTCEKSTEVEGLEAKLAAVTAVAAVFGVTSAILLVLLLFLHREWIVLKWRELCSENPSERLNRNQLQMDRQFNTDSHIYTDLRRNSQGDNLGSSGNDAPIYVNAGRASGDVVYPSTSRSMGTARP